MADDQVMSGTVGDTGNMLSDDSQAPQIDPSSFSGSSASLPSNILAGGNGPAPQLTPQPSTVQGANGPVQVNPSAADFNQTPGIPDISQAPQAAGQPSVWKDLVMGAIYGLAGSAGAKHFGSGLAGGAAGYIEGKQQEVQNANAAKQLQFESVKAADSHINALDEHRRADQLDEEGKLDYKQKSAQYQQYLQDNFGIEPNLSFNDSNTEANAGLQTLANQNGGTIPPVSVVHQPEIDGTDGKVAAYSPSQQQMRQNANGFRNLINTQRAVQGLPEIDDATFNSLGFKGQRDAAQSAIEFLKPTPAYTLDKNNPNYLPNVLAQKKQQLQQYESHKDVNGNSDADPNVEKQLQNGIDFLQTAWDTGNKMENQAQVENIKATAGPKAAAAGQAAGAEAKARLPYELTKSRAEQALKDGDPSAAGQLLVNGDIAPSQIISSRQPAFAQQAFSAAKQLNPNWNAQSAEGYFKTASAPQNVQFFGSAKSLTDQGGTLDQLQTAYNNLPNGQIPAFNKVADWTSAAAGKGATAAFAQTAIGVADDYAKVMGGGTGSDKSRDQVLQSFAMAHSPEQMADAITAARQAVDSQMNGRIGSNPVMKRMYGDQMLVHVKTPDGGEHTFRNQQQADQFKKLAGIQ